jgi:carbonic anhydrase/acetyltransferase-like protein (isoleucine patch superfamily)
VVVGTKCNIQSATVIHGLEDSDTIIGSHCTIGHRSILHGCSLGDNVTVGMGSIVMGYSKIGSGSVIGAGSLITERKTFEKNSLIIGSPADVKKSLPESAITRAFEIAEMYSKEGIKITKELKRI